MKQKTAIILHGGAMKGAFAAGAIYALANMGIRAADIVIGTSSSVPTAAYFVSKQFEYIRGIWTKELSTPNFIKYRNLFLGNPIFDLQYLIHTVFRKKCPLDTQNIFSSPSDFLIPVFSYEKGTSELFHAKNEEKDFWKLMQAAMTIHDAHLVPGKFKEFVDVDLDPFGIYRKDVIPPNYRVLVVVNHVDLHATAKKKIGIKAFRLLQSRNFPKGVKRELERRLELIESGLKCFEKFKEAHKPLIISPGKDAKSNILQVLLRNNTELCRMFHSGEVETEKVLKKGESSKIVQAFISRSQRIEAHSSLYKT